VTLDVCAVSREPDPDPAPRTEEDPEPQPEPEDALLPHSIAPRTPRTIGGAVFLLVLAGTVAGVLVVALSDWQGGLTLSGGSLVAGAVARLVLPNRQAGMLGVRRKLVDVTTLLVLGGGLVALAALIPPRRAL
jgi:hypothetical protein